MARITVESFKGSLFELVIVASQRARELINGAPSVVKRRKNKEHILALRELEEGMLDVEKLREKVVVSFQKHKTFEQTEDVLDDTPALNVADAEEIEKDMENLSHGEPESMSGFDEEEVK